MFHFHVLHTLLLAGGGLVAYSLYKGASGSPGWEAWNVAGNSGAAAPSAGPVTPAVGSPASVAGYAVSGSSPAHAGVRHYQGHTRQFFQGQPQVGVRVGANTSPGVGPWNNPYFHHVGANAYRIPPRVGAFGHPNPHHRGMIGRV
jgi:hypothetical protein